MRFTAFRLIGLLILLTACEKPESRAVILAKELLKDGVVTAIEGVRLLDVTDKWRENSFLIEVPSKNLNRGVLADRTIWSQEPLDDGDPKAYQRLLSVNAPFTSLKPDPGKGKMVVFAIKKFCWLYVITGDGDKAYVVRHNY